jgi:AraC family transcriptional regulator
MRVRSALVGDTSDFSAILTYYPPGLLQPPHKHGASQLSFLLAGSLWETANGCDVELDTAHVCRKPGGTVHSNRFGKNGALLLSFHFKCEEAAERTLSGRSWAWSRLTAGQLFAAVAASRKGGEPDELWDQLATGEEAKARGFPPDWLRWAKSRIEAYPALASIGDLATEAGVHRVHLSREFARYFGTSPSTFRLREMSGHALNRIMHKIPPALAAQEAGFADQSHMLRTVKRMVGFAPGRIAGLLS